MGSNASADALRYREGYRDITTNDLSMDLNKRFYANTIVSQPDGEFIDTIHEKWAGNYDLLETHHGYIQWLFPIREQGMNSHAQPLQRHELEFIRDHQQARVVRSYELMLDFYGMRLKDRDTGEIERSDNWVRCYHNLNTSGHNYLRITRILKVGKVDPCPWGGNRRMAILLTDRDMILGEAFVWVWGLCSIMAPLLTQTCHGSLGPRRVWLGAIQGSLPELCPP
eukprot:m.120738 g.120738  ORF g.120738 m.120738 type:complete len:225 (-) comp16515_c0_seq3:270-944(-)